jgi:hypothetical protein
VAPGRVSKRRPTDLTGRSSQILLYSLVLNELLSRAVSPLTAVNYTTFASGWETFGIHSLIAKGMSAARWASSSTATRNPTRTGEEAAAQAVLELAAGTLEEKGFCEFLRANSKSTRTR